MMAGHQTYVNILFRMLWTVCFVPGLSSCDAIGAYLWCSHTLKPYCMTALWLNTYKHNNEISVKLSAMISCESGVLLALYLISVRGLALHLSILINVVFCSLNARLVITLISDGHFGTRAYILIHFVLFWFQIYYFELNNHRYMYMSDIMEKMDCPFKGLLECLTALY